jgi:hypothetical protein
MINMSRSCATAALAGLLFACVDPEARLDDFGDRVIDGGQIEQIDAAEVDEIPNATGTYLMGFAAAVAPDDLFQFLADVTVDIGDDGATLAISAQPLSASGREPIGDPLVIDGVDISSTAEFVAVFAEAPDGDCLDAPDETDTIPGAANPVSGSALTLAATLSGQIVSENQLCGQVTGCEYSLSLNLTGSTFAMIRVDPDASSEDLPEAVGSCAALPDEDDGDNGNGDNGNGDNGNGDNGNGNGGNGNGNGNGSGDE